MSKSLTIIFTGLQSEKKKYGSDWLNSLTTGSPKAPTEKEDA